MERRLVIHIGCHKTGTTSLQRALFLNRKKIGEKLYTPFFLGLDGKEKCGSLYWWFNDLVEIEEKFRNKRCTIYDFGEYEKSFKSKGCTIKEGMVNQILETKGDVLVSSEHFSWIYDKTELEKLRDNLTNSFSTIKIIVYIRRQDKHVVSHYQQAAKTLPAALFYGTEPLALPEYKDHFRNYLDYNKRLGMWGDVFGSRNLTIRIFEDKHLYGGCSVRDFFKEIGVDIDIDVIKGNESLGGISTKIGHLAMKAGCERKIVDELIKNIDDANKLLPSREEAKKFYSHFIESNELLNQRFNLSKNRSIFSNSFENYPKISNQYWTEESVNYALITILSAVDEHWLNRARKRSVIKLLKKKISRIKK